MDFIFDLLQAAGIAAAMGIRPLLPVLLAGGLAGADLGLDFEGTDFAFLEEPWFLAVAASAWAVGGDAARAAEVLERGWAAYATAAIAGPLALLEGAGSMADRGHPAWVGMVVGLVCGRSGWRPRVAVRPRAPAPGSRGRELSAALRRGRRAGRLRALDPLPAAGADRHRRALLWLLLGSRRREGEKYAGLRDPAVKKLVLVVIDAMKPAMLERAVAAGRAPALKRLMERATSSTSASPRSRR